MIKNGIIARLSCFGLLVCAASSLVAVSAGQPAPADHPPVDAIAGIVASFRNHPVVMIGEWVPGLQQMGDFYQRLLQDPRLQNAVQDIVVEFASRSNQAILDRYIAGEEVSLDQLRNVWRDTTRTGMWDSPIYAEFLATVREVNRKLPHERQLRVLAGDVPVEWSHINSHAELKAAGDSNESFADVILTQALAKHRCVLAILNGQNVAKLGHEGKPNAATMIEAKYPGATYVIIHHRIPKDPDEARMQIAGHPETATLSELAGTSLAGKPDHNGVTPVQWVDAWLYVGAADLTTRVFPAKDSVEPSYIKEVDRRSTIEWGDTRARRLIGQPFPPK